MDNLFVPSNHIGFIAKKLFEGISGTILDCSIAYIEPRGGGPDPSHTHHHDHLFVVVEGCATIKIGEDKIIVNLDESVIVPGSVVHSIWNESEKPLKMIGINIQAE